MTAKIYLGPGLWATLDREDRERLKGHRYYSRKIRRHVYAARVGRYGRHRTPLSFVQLSHDVLGLPAGVRVRHRNGDRLDCRRENLEVIGGQVYRMPHVTRKPYAARIRFEGGRYFLGCWPTRGWAELACRLAAERAAEIKGRGLSRAKVRGELRRAVGLDA